MRWQVDVLLRCCTGQPLVLWDLHSNKIPSKYDPKSVIQAVLGAVQAVLRTGAPSSCFAWVGPPRDRVKLSKLETLAFSESCFRLLGVGNDSKVFRSGLFLLSCLLLLPLFFGACRFQE